MKTHKLLKKTVLWLLTVLSLSLFAREGVDTSGGGNIFGAEFRYYAEQAIAIVEKNQASFKELDVRVLRRILGESRILFVSEIDLSDYHSQVELNAYSRGDLKVIYVEQEKWSSLTIREKRVMALHEVLVLAGIESNDNYPVSSKLFGLSDSQSLEPFYHLTKKFPSIEKDAKKIMSNFIATRALYESGEISDDRYQFEIEGQARFLRSIYAMIEALEPSQKDEVLNKADIYFKDLLIEAQKL